MTSISLILVGVYKDVFLPKVLSIERTQQYRQKATQWLDNLPPIMRLSSLLRNEGLTRLQRRSIFLVHLQYLGVLLLLCRRHLFHLATIHQETSWELDGDVEDAMNFAGEAIEAAVETTRLMEILLSEQAIYKRCWMIIYQSFSACAILLFHAAQKNAHGCDASEYQHEMSKAEICLATLQFCASSDPIARGYYAMLSYYHDILKSMGSSQPQAQSMNGNLSGHSISSTPYHSISERQQHHEELAASIGEARRAPTDLDWPRVPDTAGRRNGFYSLGLRSDADEEDRSTRPVSGSAYVDSLIVSSPFQWSTNGHVTPL
jgi:hypothetical protein